MDSSERFPYLAFGELQLTGKDTKWNWSTRHISGVILIGVRGRILTGIRGAIPKESRWGIHIEVEEGSFGGIS